MICFFTDCLKRFMMFPVGKSKRFPHSLQRFHLLCSSCQCFSYTIQACCNNALKGALSNFKKVPFDLCKPREALRQSNKDYSFTLSFFYSQIDFYQPLKYHSYPGLGPLWPRDPFLSRAQNSRKSNCKVLAPINHSSNPQDRGPPPL